MKKIIAIIVIIVLLIVVGISTYKYLDNKPFNIDKEYYGTGEIIEIDYEELDKILSEKKSFGLFIYQPLCGTSYNFESVVTNFSEENNVTFYKIAYSAIKEEYVGKTLKYYPSFALINKGKIKEFLRSDSNEDIYYYSEEGFTEWFNKYITN